ncbi:MAG: DUF1080 domain-containing protein, partial [Bacteroidia bacterium]|nr:DUF1080 domain-containing protein [Bacteroidia bacterium]
DIKIAGSPLNVNFNNTFRVKDGVMQANYDQYKKFNGEYGHIFYKDKFSYYKIRVQYRFVGQQTPGGAGWAFRNSGIMLHCQSAASMTRDQSFPTSIEFQLLGGPGEGERPTGNLCTPGTNVVMKDSLFTPHCINSSSKTYNGDQWVEAEAVVLGNSRITHIINGDTVLTYTKPQLDEREATYPEMFAYFGSKMLKEGYISLQGESHPVEFRKVELLNLKGCMDPKALNYKSFYIKSDNSQCRYK